jgi:hypothetical protein
MYAIPLFAGTLSKNCSNASKPPADAPMQTIGNLLISESAVFAFEDSVDLAF